MTANDEALAVKYFRLTCVKTGKSFLRFFQNNNGFPTSTPAGRAPIKREISSVTKRKTKFHLKKIWSHFTCKQHFSLASTFLRRRVRIYFSTCQSTSTSMWTGITGRSSLYADNGDRLETVLSTESRRIYGSVNITAQRCKFKRVCDSC